MENILNFSTSDSTRTSVYRIAGALMALQVLFPPKVWNNGFMNLPLGPVFIFHDPMAAVNQFSQGMLPTGTSIAWMQLIVQLVISAAIAYGVTRYMESNRDQPLPNIA